MSQTSPDSSSWVNDEQVTRTYDAADTSTGADFLYNLAHVLPLTMLNGNGGPSYGMVDEEINKIWDGVSWVNENRQTYDYTGNNTLMNIYNFNWEGTDWVYNENQEYFYDDNNNVAELDENNWNGSDWTSNSRILYDWGTFTANEDNYVTPQTLNLSVYPNPFAGNINLNVNSKSNAPIHVSVYNLKGELVKTTLSRSNTSTTLNSDTLPTGVYLVKANQGNSNATIKILKIK